MPHSSPSVSVVVTTYNQAAYIEATLRSVLDQTYRASEVIVVDDGSTDRTPEVLAQFGREVTCIRQANTGVAGSRNRGVSEATGDLIALIDGDDLWDPRKLERQVGAFRTYPDSGLIACDARLFDGDRVLKSELLRPSAPDLFPDDGTSPVSLRCYERLLQGNFIATTSQVMVPREILEHVGPSDTALPTCSDYDLYLRIASKYPLTFVRDSLTHWRYLPTSASGPATGRRLRWSEDDIIATKKQLRSATPLARPVVRRALSVKMHETARLAYDYGLDVDRGVALKYLWRLAWQNPAEPAVWLHLAGLFAGPWLRRRVGPRVTAALRRR
jgi:glycosyltransferase involved in cell wall biosynthesis